MKMAMAKFRYWFGLVLVGLFAFWVPNVISQQLVPIDNEELRYEKRGNRWEGFLKLKVADELAEGQVSLVVLSFTHGKPEFDVKSQSPVRLTGNPPAVSVGDTMQIRVKPIFSDDHYRMDTAIPFNGHFDWPVNEVLGKSELLSIDQIGIVGWTNSSAGDSVLVAVRMLQDGNFPDDDACHLVIYAPVDIESVKMRVYPETELAPVNWVTIKNRLYAGQCHRIKLETHYEEISYIDFRARVAGTHRSIRELSLRVSMR